IAALELILELGVENIARELLRKRDFLLSALQAAGCVVLQPEAASENATAILSFQRHGIDSINLQQNLLQNRIVSSVRVDRAGQKYIRFSPHFYNSEAELEEVLKTLKNLT